MLRRCKRSLSAIKDLSKKGRRKSDDKASVVPQQPDADRTSSSSSPSKPHAGYRLSSDLDAVVPDSDRLSRSSDSSGTSASSTDGAAVYDNADANNNNNFRPEVREFLGLDNKRNATKQDEDTAELDEQETMNGNKDTSPINLGPTEKTSVRPSDFEFLKVIGKGSFGKVLLARHKEEKKVFAVKVLQKAAIMKRNEAKHIMSERNVLLRNVHHPFLVGLHYSFQTADKLYFVLDYVNGGELFFHLQRERCFPEQRAKFYAAEIASALGYLHSENIIYRDLKPENILLDSKGHVVLTDFGLCKEGITGEKTTCTFCGTPEYLAPEVLRKEPYDKTVDWWCLGAVLFEMVYGLPPFYSRDTSEMYDSILHKPLRLRANVSAAGRDLLEGLLQKDKTRRLGAKRDFEEIQQKAFFADINWENLYNKKLQPPYNPNVSGQLDLRHFDPDFVREPVPASVGRSGGSSCKFVSASVMEADAVFDGFSYVPPSEDAFG